MSTEVFNYVFRQYPERVLLSNARRAKYHILGIKIESPEYPAWLQKQPKWMQKGLADMLYVWKPHKLTKGEEYRLYNVMEDCFVIKNKKVAGTPRHEMINGQRMWDQNMDIHSFRKVKDQLKLYFVPELVRQNIEGKKFSPGPDKFIHFEYIYYVPLTLRGRAVQDYFNHSLFYQKAFEDILQEEGWIDSDAPNVVRGGYPRYVDIPTEETRRLEVKIHFCRNNERIS